MNESKPMNERELKQIVNKGKSEELTDLEKIHKSKEILKKNVEKSKITFSKPIVTIDGKPFIYPRTINVIQGKSGTHKSRLAEHLCSVILKGSNHGIDLLRMESKECNNSICYVDTERNISEQYPFSLQQIKLNAGYEINTDIKNFDFITLIEIERQKRFIAFREYLEKSLRETYNGHILVILDVLTDLVENFNDPKDSLRLIDLLNSAINTYDVTFLCIIHENPFQEKARGHLGTELLNKSSTALSINFERDGKGNELDLIKIQFLKSRSAKKFEPMFVKYSDDKKCLVFAEHNEIEKAKSLQDKKANIFEIVKYLVENLSGEISKKDLIELLKENFNCGARTIEDRITDLLRGKAINDLGYRLINSKRGKNIFYKIELLPETPSKLPE